MPYEFRRFLFWSVVAASVFSTAVSADSAKRSVPKDFRERQIADWILQDAGPEAPRAFSDADGNALEKEMLRKVFDELDDGASLRGEMDELRQSNRPGSDPVWKEFYLKACGERRRLRLRVVYEKYPEIVFAKHQVLGGSHYAYTEAVSDAQYPERRDMICGKLVKLTLLPDGSTEETLLVEAPKEGTLRDPDVSFDGRKIVFSMRKHLETDDYHLYDYDLVSGEVRQLTFGDGFADIEPCYLPDGNILFGSTRCMQIVDCWRTDVSNFYHCDADGRFMRRISFDQVHVNYPRVLADGRVIYTRWDYNDRGQLYPQPLFMMNYDGTGQTEYYGNNSWFPTTIMHARGIPDSNKVIAIASGHHTHQRGKLLLIDRTKGTQEAEGAQLIAPTRETKSVRIDRYGQDGDQFQYPLPIDERNFIVAYTPDGFSEHRYDIPFGIYYMDLDNTKRELLAWDPTVSSGQPVPLQARPVPILRATPVDYEMQTGHYYVQDVYEGPGLEGIERGTVKELRVVALEFRAAGILNNDNGGPAGGAFVSTPVSIRNGSWDVKRVLGTVPVETDGSAYFEVPARTPVYFQLLDERGNMVQSMRSWSTLQPGELFSCIGCHEAKGATRNNPLSRGGANRSLALRKAPKKPVPLSGMSTEGFSFRRTIQPILDRHCVACHTGAADAPFSLLGTKYKPVFNTDNHKNGPDVGMAGRRFSEAYVNLTQKGEPNDIVRWLNVQSVPTMLPPRFAGAAKSKLPRMFDEENRAEQHKDVRLDDLEKRKLALWIDLLVPFDGSFDAEVDWDARQRAEYAYYKNKRDRMAEIERENIRKLIDWQSGEIALPAPESFTRFDAGGPEAKKRFIEQWLKDHTEQ